jgi:hypothetical protein
MAEMFAKKLHSRDKIVSVWDKSDYNIDSRQPCTIVLQPIMEHDNKMSMVVYMRNNDMINIFPSDIFIHSTYLKYWCAKSNIEYKNIYWISAIAYYQKKRDEMKFVDRLIQQWSDDYTKLKITPSHWSPDFIKDLQIKEEIEELARSAHPSGWAFQEWINRISSPYVSEWTRIMLLAEAKRNKDKEIFQEILKQPWITEFGKIKDSLISPR